MWSGTHWFRRSLPLMSVMSVEGHRLSLSVQYASIDSELPSRAHFRRWARLASGQDIEITLRIVDEEEGRSLNSSYRGKNYATNVLTFVYDDDQPLKGDVVICAPVVKREAGQQNKTWMAHFAHMTIHALLHLQGFDHENDADAEKMEALETELMLKLRYHDPYQV